MTKIDDKVKEFEIKFCTTVSGGGVTVARWINNEENANGTNNIVRFLRQALQEVAQETRREVVKDIRKSTIWKLVPDTPRMIMCKDIELDELLTKLNNNEN